VSCCLSAAAATAPSSACRLACLACLQQQRIVHRPDDGEYTCLPSWFCMSEHCSHILPKLPANKQQEPHMTGILGWHEERTWRRSPRSHLPGMMPVVYVNAQLLQALHVGLRFTVARQGLVAAPLCSLQRDWQLEAAEVDKVLRAAVSPPPTQSMHSSSCQHSIQSQRLCCSGCRCSVLLSITEQQVVEWLGKCCMLTAVYIHR